ncbi:PP2C family protein-serine/threonine phosphatase [Mycoplasmopsis adleri]|uniref:PP2C family protein-serine/threonine phosphatase n=1 Tax=Mycoplasmopsis adleri TaxID=51362 RepID=UPI003873B2BA
MDFGKTSDVGRVRLENQDALAIFANDDFVFLLLCDGMGGHYGGGIASSTTISTFDKEFKKSFPKHSQPLDVKPYIEWFKNTILLAKNEMTRLSDRDEAKLDMGTTVTGALINHKENYIIVFNIGDSRTYALTTSGELIQVTTDHNYLNQLIAQGVPELEARKHRNQAALTSALGPDKKLKIAVTTIMPNDYKSVYSLIVTSDGVHDFIDKPEMEQRLRQAKSAQKLTEELVLCALDNHSTDNSSCGIVVLDNEPLWR